MPLDQISSDRFGSVRLRPAEASDAKPASELIYLPKGRFADYVFGADDPVKARDVICKLFAQRENRFSYEFADVLESDGEVIGVLVGYPSDTLPSLSVPMGKQLAQILGPAGLWRLLKRSVPLMKVKEAEPGEFYIFNLAIRPDFQKAGLGPRLLQNAEEKARRAGLSKASLGVTMDNQGALRFYFRHGYRSVETIPAPKKLQERIGYDGFYRLVKELEIPS